MEFNSPITITGVKVGLCTSAELAENISNTINIVKGNAQLVWYIDGLDS